MLTVKTEDTDDPEVCHYHRDCCAHWALWEPIMYIPFQVRHLALKGFTLCCGVGLSILNADKLFNCCKF